MSAPENTGLKEAIAKAMAHYESLSAVDKALMEAQQKRSWVIGETGRDPGLGALANEVLRLRRELKGQRDKLNSEERGKLEMLKRRAYHLQNRIDKAPRMDLSYDKRELSAIRWAVERIGGEHFGPFDDCSTAAEERTE
jgi:hypothetical protein